jgi:hypothetical protein
MRRLAVGLAVLGLAACWLGCGGGNYSSPKATFETMHAAAKAGDRNGVLNCFDDASRKAILDLEQAIKDVPALKEMFEGGDIVGKLSAELKKQEPKIGEEKITGEKATLNVTMDKKAEDLPFVREHGAWKMRMPGEMPSADQIKDMVAKMKAMTEGKKGK